MITHGNLHVPLKPGHAFSKPPPAQVDSFRTAALFRATDSPWITDVTENKGAYAHSRVPRSNITNNSMVGRFTEKFSTEITSGKFIGPLGYQHGLVSETACEIPYKALFSISECPQT